MPSVQTPPRIIPPETAPDQVAEFVRRHQVGLWRFLRVLGCRGQQAEAIAQDAFVLALQRGVHTTPLGLEALLGPAAFLRATAKFLWLREQRDEQRRTEHHTVAAELRMQRELERFRRDEANERLWQRELEADDGEGWLQALDRCLEALPERSRLALDRTYRDGVGRRELGEELGIGEHGVRTLLQRLRAALRECIERWRQS